MEVSKTKIRILNQKSEPEFFLYVLEDYQQVLLEDIDADQLPIAYGGTAKDSLGDPTCSEFVSYFSIDSLFKNKL